MTDLEREMIEDYLMFKGIESFLNNPDNVELDRQKLINEYIELTKSDQTRISYLKLSN